MQNSFKSIDEYRVAWMVCIQFDIGLIFNSNFGYVSTTRNRLKIWSEVFWQFVMALSKKMLLMLCSLLVMLAVTCADNVRMINKFINLLLILLTTVLYKLSYSEWYSQNMYQYTVNCMAPLSRKHFTATLYENYVKSMPNDIQYYHSLWRCRFEFVSVWFYLGR